jgi:hypothetical protein
MVSGNLSAYISWQSLTILGAALLFAVFLIWKLRPTFPLPRLSMPAAWWGGAAAEDVASLRAEIAAMRDTARRARTPRERAEALAHAAALVGKNPLRLTSAMGLYLRAMRADPTFGEAVRGICALLASDRPELLEAVLWRRLSHLHWEGETAEAARCAADGLIALYRHELRHRDRARVMKKLSARIGQAH